MRFFSYALYAFQFMHVFIYAIGFTHKSDWKNAQCLQFMRLSEYGEKPNIFDYAEYMKDLNEHYADNPQPQKKLFRLDWKYWEKKWALLLKS